MIKRILFASIMAFWASLLLCCGVWATENTPAVETYEKVFVDFAEKSSVTIGTVTKKEGYTIEECGVILSENNPAAEISDPDAFCYKHRGDIGNDGRFAIKLIDSRNLMGNGFYTRAYIVYSKNGERFEKYAGTSVYSSLIPKSEFAEISELSSKVSEAEPGDEFIIKNGIYENVSFSVSGEGRYGAPVKIKAETPGGVVFSGKADITVTGKYIELSDFRFENTRSDISIIKLKGAYGCRVTGCYFYDIFGETSTFVTCITASEVSSKNRADHNVFERTGGGLSVAVGYNENALNTDNRADHNYYKDVPAVSEIFPGEVNGFEQAGAGTSKTHDHIAPRMIVEDNLFENIIGDKSEVICIKSSENIIRYNTFLNCELSGPDFRNGGSCVFEGNFCINLKTGIRSYGANQVIRNNYFYNCQRGVELTATDEGNLLQEGSQYRQSKNVTVEGNMFIYPGVCGIKLGSGYNPLNGYTYIPEYTKIKDNVFVVDRAPAIIHSNSIFDDFSGNIVSVSGTGTTGTLSDGFETKKLTLEYDGQIYLPSGMGMDKRGLKTTDDVGPEKKWWTELLKNPADDIRASMELRSSKPDSYTPSKTEIILTEGESYNLDNTSGKDNYSGISRNVISENMSYSIADSDIAVVSGHTLTGVKEGVTKLIANSKGRTAEITLRVVKSSVNDNQSVFYSNTFDDAEYSVNLTNTGKAWKITDGKLTNSGVKTEALRMAIDNSLLVDGDFVLSFELGAKPLSAEDNGGVNGSVILGYKENNLSEYYRINFTDSLNSESIISKNNNSITDCIGIVNVNITKNTTHNIEVRKTKNKLTVLTDGRFSAVCDIPEELSGRIGFASTKIAQIDNVIMKRVSETAPPSVEKLNLTIQRTDIKEVKLTYDGMDDVIYRIYRNNIWLRDTDNTEFFDDSIKNGINYEYEISAYNRDGNLIARDSMSYVLLEETDSGLFQITDCQVRTGIDGNYDEDIYILRNKGLNANQRIYCDRVYTFGELPSEFENAAYIMTRAEDVYNSYLQSDATKDFVKFNINKSATVYLCVAPNGHKTIPGWITENEWIQTDLKAGSFTKIFARHYKVTNGVPATVEIGGFKDKLPMMYSVVIVPGETPEDFFAVSNCQTKTGTDGTYESGLYTIVSSGLRNGCVIYNDRVYTYEGIPSELENSAYIMTSNNHITNAELQSGETSDFLKLNINKSATVYILLAPNKNTVSVSTHPWISDWILTGYSAGSFTKIYKRHYDVPAGNTVSVSIGGFKGKLPSMYTVVIKPD